MSLTKIAGDLALMGSGPRSGIGEIFLPELQKGSSIMPGKVNPVLPEVVLQVSAQVIGNDTAITIGGLQGQFELNVRIPLIARNLLQSIHLLSTSSRLFAEKCVEGIEANLEGCERSAEGTLAVATALNPYIGYDRAAEIVKDARAAAGRCARSRASTASTRRRSTRRWTCARSRRARRPPRATSRRTTTRFRARPRASEEFGPLRLFVPDGAPWPYYARPAGGDVTARDVRAVRSRQWELGLPEAFEWVVDLAPTLGAGRAPDRAGRARAAADGARAPARRARRRCPRPPAGARRPGAARGAGGRRHRVRRARHGRRRRRSARARRRRSAHYPEARLGVVRERMRTGLTVTVVAEDDDGVLAVGSHQPVGGVTEIVGVGTLPAARRRGLGAAVTAALVADARRGGADIVFLSAGSDDIARMYGRLGFTRVATAGIALPAVSS